MAQANNGALIRVPTEVQADAECGIVPAPDMLGPYNNNDAGTETTVTILGVDEADSAKGQISWVSPVARALLKAKVGDSVRLVVPGGTQELEVLAVNYPAPTRST